MDLELERKAYPLLMEALDQPPDARDAWLARSCAGDEALRTRVLTLLTAFARSTRPLPTNLIDVSAARMARAPPPERVGPFKLERVLGAGGMGAVHLGRRDDGRFEQSVAVKLLGPRAMTPAGRALFDAERRTLASLGHPNISRILDGGETEDGAPYLVMELVDGQPLTAWARARALSLEARLRLFQKVCAAVSYAHRNRVIHHDLKPANILVADDGEPKLIDFGVALVLDRIGDHDDAAPADRRGLTVAYASPEALRGEHTELTSDVFSLGVILHELVFGRLPFDVAELDRRAAAETVETTPPRFASESAPARRSPRIVDLERVIAKALRPEPPARYESVRELSAEIDRLLEARPVAAAEGEVGYVIARFLQRNRLGATAAGLALAALIGGLAVTTALYHRANAARTLADQRFEDVRELASFMLFDLEDELSGVAGATRARVATVEEGKTYLDALAASSAASPDLMLEVARGYARLGEVVGDIGGASLGDEASLESNLAQAADIEARVVDEHPERADARVELANTRAYLSGVVLFSLDSDRDAEAIARAGQAAVAPLDPDPARDLDVWAADARATVALAEAMVWDDRAEEAIATLKTLETGFAAVDAATREGAVLSGPYLKDLGLMSDALSALDRDAEAADVLDELVAARRRALAADPDNVELIRALVGDLWSASNIAGALGRAEAALAASSEAYELTAGLVEADPDDKSALRLEALVASMNASSLAQNARYDEARAAAEQSLALRESLLAEAPDDVSRQYDVIAVYPTLADVSEMAGRSGEACAWRIKARDGFEAFDAEWGLDEAVRNGSLVDMQAAASACEAQAAN